MRTLFKLIMRARRCFWRWQCRKYGCITTGPYYGMPQSHCRRCGKRLWGAIDGQTEFVEPWGEYALRAVEG